MNYISITLLFKKESNPLSTKNFFDGYVFYFLSSPQDIFSWLLRPGVGRGRNQNIDCLPLLGSLTRDPTHNPSSVQDDGPTNWATQARAGGCVVGIVNITCFPLLVSRTH